jgi:hypothetical protein
MKSKICSNLFFAGEVTYVFSFKFFDVNTYAAGHDIDIEYNHMCQCQALSRVGQKNIILFYCDLIDVYVADTEC